MTKHKIFIVFLLPYMSAVMQNTANITVVILIFG